MTQFLSGQIDTDRRRLLKLYRDILPRLLLEDLHRIGGYEYPSTCSIPLHPLHPRMAGSAEVFLNWPIDHILSQTAGIQCHPMVRADGRSTDSTILELLFDREFDLRLTPGLTRYLGGLCHQLRQDQLKIALLMMGDYVQSKDRVGHEYLPFDIQTTNDLGDSFAALQKFFSREPLIKIQVFGEEDASLFDSAGVLTTLDLDIFQKVALNSRRIPHVLERDLSVLYGKDPGKASWCSGVVPRKIPSNLITGIQVIFGIPSLYSESVAALEKDLTNSDNPSNFTYSSERLHVPSVRKITTGLLHLNLLRKYLKGMYDVPVTLTKYITRHIIKRDSLNDSE